MATFSNLKKVNNAKSGFGKVLIAPYSVITAHPTVGSGTGVGDSKILTTAPTFASNKGFLDLGVEVDLSKLDGAATGDYGSTTKEVKFSFDTNGLKAKQLEMLDLLLEDELAILIKSPDCGSTENPLYIGCDCKGARANWKLTSGAVKGGGKKGAVVEVVYLGGLMEANFTIVADASAAV
jgi:hypothetical protein